MEPCRDSSRIGSFVLQWHASGSSPVNTRGQTKFLHNFCQIYVSKKKNVQRGESGMPSWDLPPARARNVWGCAVCLFAPPVCTSSTDWRPAGAKKDTDILADKHVKFSRNTLCQLISLFILPPLFKHLIYWFISENEIWNIWHIQYVHRLLWQRLLVFVYPWLVRLQSAKVAFQGLAATVIQESFHSCHMSLHQLLSLAGRLLLQSLHPLLEAL